jgi:dihydropteroate synthase
MAERLLFLTGHLAHARLIATLDKIGLSAGSWRVLNIGVKVAALMTEPIIANRLHAPIEADRVILPGRCRVDLFRLSQQFGARFERGPDEIIDLPQYLGRKGGAPDLSQHDIQLFAEIVEAPSLTVAGIRAKAQQLIRAGADVIDIGCQPDTAFPHLEEAVTALRADGARVSVDSGDPAELARGARAGAHYVLSLDETNLEIVSGTRATAILIAKPHGDLISLLRAVDAAAARGIPHLADPILDPIHFGFTAAIERYAALRRARPDVGMLMGTGNLTELTDADTPGLTAALLGICSELRIGNVLVVQVSGHTRRTIEEHDAARRLMFRAREDRSVPKGYGGGLLSLHDAKPYASEPEQILELAAAIRDSNFRIDVAHDGVHIYNRNGHHVSTDPFSLFPRLRVENDGAHAFYLGYEIAKAEIAWRLGKRYAQDSALDWGVAADRPVEDLTRHAQAGATLSPGGKESPDAPDRRDDPDDEERCR